MKVKVLVIRTEEAEIEVDAYDYATARDLAVDMAIEKYEEQIWETKSISAHPPITCWP